MVENWSLPDRSQKKLEFPDVKALNVFESAWEFQQHSKNHLLGKTMEPFKNQCFRSLGLGGWARSLEIAFTVF